jgi:hypothetical protein
MHNDSSIKAQAAVFAQESEGSSCYTDQLDGGKNGALYNELVDYFYYSQVHATTYLYTYELQYIVCIQLLQHTCIHVNFTMDLLANSTTNRCIYSNTHVFCSVVHVKIAHKEKRIA